MAQGCAAQVQAQMREVLDEVHKLRTRSTREVQRFEAVQQQREAVQSQLAAAQAANKRLEAELTAATAALHHQVLLMRICSSLRYSDGIDDNL